MCQVAAPIPTEIADVHSTDLLTAIKSVVLEAVETAGGEFE
jgi:hypothetical protein